MENVLSISALILSLFSFLWSLWVHQKSQLRERRQNTLDAFNALQSQVLDELGQYKKKQITEISRNNHSPEYKKLSTFLARCEHFAVGVNQKIYDIDTVRRLGGEHIVRIYENFMPLIEEKRRYKNNTKRYHEFEELARTLGYKEKREEDHV